VNDFEVEQELEVHLRRTLTEIARTTPRTITPAETAREPLVRRRVLVAAVALLVTGVGGLVALSRQPDLTSPADVTAVSTQTSVPSVEVTLPTLPSPTSTVHADGPGTSGSAVLVPEELIPPPLSSADPRGPFERFLGLPLDPIEAQLTDDRALSGVIAVCMAERGFEYFLTPDGEDTVANDDYVASLSVTRTNEYMSNLYGPCEGQAADQVYVLNAFEAEWAGYDQRFRGDRRVMVVTETTDRCLRRLGGPDRPVAQAPAADIEQCQIEAGWDAVRREVLEEVETAFIVDHADALIRFRDNRDSYSQRDRAES
jgi:hypothetical protein